MIGRRIVLCAVAGALMAFGACSSDPPPPPPPEPAPAEDNSDAEEEARRRAAAQARADSIAEARRIEEARRAAVANLTAMVFFDYDESTITAEGESILRDKVEVLRSNPGVRIRIEGHADERGSTEYNVALGNRRAEAVVRFLTSFGIDASRFTTTSFGEERPLQRGESESAFARNRRAEFVITAGESSITS